MTQHARSSSSSTPTGPLILFLALCFLFQIPAFTKATDSAATTTSSSQSPPPADPNQNPPLKINVASNHTHDLRAAAPDPAPAPAPEPQLLTITATGVYSQQPQYPIYTTTAPLIQPQVIVTQYITPATTTYYTPPQQKTSTTTLPAGFIAGGYYCSTLYAQGAGLPTTRQGNCGTILVESSPVAAQPSHSGAGAQGVIGGGKSMLAMVLVLAIGVAGLG